MSRTTMVDEIRMQAERFCERRWPYPVDEGRQTAAVADPELAYLNRRWILESVEEASVRRPPPDSRLRRVVRLFLRPVRPLLHAVRRATNRLVARLVFPALVPYLLEEREYLEHLVRFQNEIARRLDDCDRRTGRLSQTVGSLARTAELATAELADRDLMLDDVCQSRLRHLNGGRPHES